MAGAPILQLSDITKAFGRLQALNRCSLSVETGSITGLIGPNGAGKTTLFNVVSGFVPQDSGRVLFRGRDVSSLSPFRRIRRGLARTFQLPRIFPKMTVVEHLRLAPAVDGRGELIQDLFHRAGLNPLLGEYAGNLSFGQQKLVSIVQALASGPALVLLDEPAAGINPTLQQTILELIHHVNTRGATFVIIEHDMRVVMEHCHPIVALNFGSPIAMGSREEIRSNRALLDAYFGRHG